jgi:2-keto-4-pentenoate hydratase/2-oxohepta-3-ene-1,7-dioic acid hydratase in catechol pathway
MTFKFACRNGRAQIVVGPENNTVDLETASGGKFSSEPIDAFRRWDEVRAFAASCTDPGVACSTDDLNAPSPWPSQVFGIGLNYRKHAEESGAKIPTTPLTFTKFPSSVGNPNADVPIVGGAVDWEVELVVVISNGGRDISEDDAWNHVAGVCVGQDISDRALQMATQPPQFNLGKSRKNYSVRAVAGGCKGPRRPRRSGDQLHGERRGDAAREDERPHLQRSAADCLPQQHRAVAAG